MPSINPLRIFGDHRFPMTQPSGHRNTVKLVANVPQTIPIPDNATIATFSANGEFYANYDTAAIVPAANDLSGDAADYAPGQRHIGGYTTISVVAPLDTTLQLCFWRS